MRSLILLHFCWVLIAFIAFCGDRFWCETGAGRLAIQNLDLGRLLRLPLVGFNFPALNQIGASQ